MARSETGGRHEELGFDGGRGWLAGLRELGAKLFGTLLRRRRAAGRGHRGYRPERHYLRGPGPACRARQPRPPSPSRTDD